MTFSKDEEIHSVESPIAIIGMSCFFPKSRDLKGYWKVLFQGIDAISVVPDTHWSAQDYFDPDPKRPDHVYCKRGGFLSPVIFDPTEFGIPPTALEATDTSQLLALIAAKHALADAGYANGRSFNRERTSVILGVTGMQELVIPLSTRLSHPVWRRVLNNAGLSGDKTEEIIQSLSDSYVSWQENSFPGLLGNVVAGRISSRLDLGGTNCVVDAACASSMGAIHLAALELFSGRSDMVITGGVDTLNDIFMHMCFAKTQVLSSTGDARPFSKDADGTVLGEGVGLLVLKRLVDAERDHDRIYAVIRGIGTSSDGKSGSIYAPQAKGQVKALKEAYRNAGFEPGTVELVEAHGTGTKIGDRVEFQALSEVFSESNGNAARCALGSVKSMIGHTKAAAGAAGMIKTALALYNKVLPPTLKVENPDPGLNIKESPFYLNTQSRPWLSLQNHPRRAGVSAFGFGGSNFHAVLEEYKHHKTEASWDGSIEIFAWSAENRSRLIEKLKTLKDRIDVGLPINELISTAAASRAGFSVTDAYRLLLVFDLCEEQSDGLSKRLSRIIEQLGKPEAKESLSMSFDLPDVFFGGPEKSGGPPQKKLAFVFPGQGSQYVGMGRDLICLFPEASGVFESFDCVLEDIGRLGDFIFPVPAVTGQERQEQEERLRRTEVAQPAIGAVNLAMLKILKRFGLEADAACGHSFGELNALEAAGQIDSEAFFTLAIARGRLMAAADGNDRSAGNGAMLAVNAPLSKIDELAHGLPGIVVANRNCPTQGVLSGSKEAIDVAEKKCLESGIRTRRLPVSAAFHSPAMEGAQKPFREILSSITINPGRMPVYSNSTAQPYPADAESLKDLIAAQITSPVDFVSEIENLYQAGIRTFVEIGPKTVLTGLIRSVLKRADVHTFSLDTSAGKGSGLADLARLLCRLAAAGHFLDLTQWEKPIEAIPRARMPITVLGANFKPQRTSAQKPVQIPLQQDETRAMPILQKADSDLQKSPDNTKKSMAAEPLPDPEQPLKRTEEKESIQIPMKVKVKPMDREKQNDSAFIQNTLAVLQEGLKSIQVLQAQTAETHQKFLETQAEAGRVLQKMMDNARHLTEVTMGIAPGLDAHSIRALKENTGSFYLSSSEDNSFADKAVREKLSFRELESKDNMTAAGGTTQLNHDSLQIKSFDTPGQTAFINQTPRTDAAKKQSILQETPVKAVSPVLQETLLKVVSDLTGYPVEMLGLDMDIETDLGIDSIKRVEILSTLEERLPGLPPVSPDQMGRFKTLSQIIANFIDKDVSSEDQASASQNVSDRDLPGPVSRVQPLQNGPDRIHEALLEVVSELTGYPVEMLGLDMDIETDLGIDSIKRVEILSTLEERLPGLPPVSPDQMGRLKTLSQIISQFSLDKVDSKEPTSLDIPPEPVKSASTECFTCEVKKPAEVDSEVLQRKVVRVVEAPLGIHPEIRLASDRSVYICGDSSDLTTSILSEFHRREIPAVLISSDKFKKTESLPKASGLLLVAPEARDMTLKEISDNFFITRSLASDLIESAQMGGAFFASITHMDGAFGFNAKGIDFPLQGSLAGLVKTASLEWEGVFCRAFDIDPQWQKPGDIATTIAAELLDADPSESIEVGLSAGRRCQLWLEPETAQRMSEQGIGIAESDVVVISGGARGIMAKAAKALAKRFRPKLVLLGRSPLPSTEPQWLKGITDESAVKKAILKNEFNKGAPTPAQVETKFRKYMVNREIRQTLARLNSNGTEAHYYSIDIRDREKVLKLFEKIRSVHGPVKAMFHGAGVLEDRMIVDKTLRQFSAVFDTKVQGLLNVIEALQGEPLDYLVLFSSVAARMGNRGQADYAMANEALNKIAWQQAFARPGCRVISFNWGPWDGGMVSADLKREFNRRQIPLIPADVGVESMLAEMTVNPGSAVEVVIGAPLTPPIPMQTEAELEIQESMACTQTPALTLTLKREVDLDNLPILNSHVLDGKPVVPLALISEWFGQGALHENPGLALLGIDDMRLLKGIRLDQQKRLVRLFAGKARKDRSLYRVDVELRDGVKEGSDVIHSRAKAVLAEALDTPPAYEIPAALLTKNYPRTREEIYEKILFHGQDLHGIKEIVNCGSQGMLARVSTAPPPERWMKEPFRSRWIADPLVLDCAFQMASVWCFEQKGYVSLPSYYASYRQYRKAFPVEEVTAVLEVNDASAHKMRGRFTFLDEKGEVIAQLRGFEAVMDVSLLKAFKPQSAINGQHER